MSMQNLRTVGLLGSASLAVVALLGCEKSGDFLLPAAVEGVPAILHIEAEEGGPFIPAVIDDEDDVRANTVYGEIGPTGDVRRSGITVEFIGTGGDVCAYVDPEMVAWNQSVSASAGVRRWRQPDNHFDDGDLDMQIGLSLYYRGTFGEQMGGFEVEYQDALGQDVEVELVACRNFTNVGGNPNFDAHAGRGTAEFCTVQNTQPGVAYTVALEGFSLPPDDYRLGFGLLIADGPCEGGDDDDDGIAEGLVDRIRPVDRENPLLVNQECIIKGEGIKPKASGAEVVYGYQEGLSWAGSEELEEHFCTEPMNTYCNQERITMTDAGIECNRTDTSPDTPDEERCYCGDSRDTPEGGAAEF